MFGGEFGASHCNQWEFCCVEVHEPIELLFGVVNGVGPGICVLDGVHVLQGNGEVSRVFCPIDPVFQWHIL